MRQVVLAAAAALFAVAPASAAVHKYSFTGTNASATNALGPTVTGFIAYDDTAPLLGTPVGLSVYNALRFFSASAGGFAMQASIAHDPNNVDTISSRGGLTFQAYEFASATVPAGYSIAAADLALRADAELAPSSILPSTLLIPIFPIRTFDVSFRQAPGVPSLDATFQIALTEVDEIPGFAAVPEPATWALLIVGFGAIGAVSRKRRATSPRLI